MALAGPAAGPGGGSIFIDGFSGGQLPSKESIREIRINANPFSPEYDKLGYGRIEIFTKPGTDKFHGTVYDNYPRRLMELAQSVCRPESSVSFGRVWRHFKRPDQQHASFFRIFAGSGWTTVPVINGITLDPQTLAIVNPFTSVFRMPQRRVSLSPRVDYQLNANNTLIVRYGFLRPIPCKTPASVASTWSSAVTTFKIPSSMCRFPKPRC